MAKRPFTAETGRPHHRPDRVVADHDAALGQFVSQGPPSVADHLELCVPVGFIRSCHFTTLATLTPNSLAVSRADRPSIIDRVNRSLRSFVIPAGLRP